MTTGITPAAMAAILNGDLANALAASTPGGIERQEAAGPQSMLQSDTLPKTIFGATRQHMEKMGFKFLGDQDDLFVNCVLPAGWSKKATSHSMHSDLLDEQGRKRAGIFYKAAFYDRQADMRFVQRYYVNSHALAKKQNDYQVVVYDGENILKSFGVWSNRDWEAQDQLTRAAKQWLAKEFPDHENPLAYWELP